MEFSLWCGWRRVFILVLQNYVASLRGELSDAITNQLSTTDGAVRDGINRFIGSKVWDQSC